MASPGTWRVGSREHYLDNNVNNTKEAYFKSHKGLIFACCYTIYAFYILTRKSFTYSMPFLMDEFLLSKIDLGWIASSFAICYGASKFFLALFRSNQPSKFLCIGLLGCALANIIFALSTELNMFIFAWSLNAIFQGTGWLQCTALLRAWFPQEEVGLYWSLLSTSSNVASALAPFIFHTMTYYAGSWQSCFFLLSFLTVGLASYCYSVLQDRPPVVQNSIVPEVKKKTPTSPRQSPRKKANNIASGNVAAWADKTSEYTSIDTSTVSEITETKEQTTSYFSLLRIRVFWICVLMSTLANVAKATVDNWAQLYFTIEKGRDDLAAGAILSSFEAGGIIGSILCGYFSDLLVKRAGKHMDGHARFPIVITCSLIAACACHALHIFSDASNSTLIDHITMFFFGTGLYGIICLLGLVTFECLPEHLTVPANAATALSSQIGGFLGGAPISYIARANSFATAFVVLEVVLVVLTIGLSTELALYLGGDTGPGYLTGVKLLLSKPKKIS